MTVRLAPPRATHGAGRLTPVNKEDVCRG